MHTQSYTVAQLGEGFLYIMAKPLGGEYLAEACQQLADLKIKQLVSLLELAEAASLGLQQQQQQLAHYGINFTSYPIKDRGLPNSLFSFSQLTRQLYQQIMSGQDTVIHCRAGIGRTGVVAAGVLLHAGYKPLEAFYLISKVRGCEVPDTEQQANWLIKNYRDIIA